MIAFDLQCASSNHRFEGWFASSQEYERQCLQGLVACPVCGSTDHPSLAMSDLPLPDEQSLQTTSREIEDLREQRENARNEAAEWEKKVSGIQAEIRLLEEGLGELAKKSLTQIDTDRKSVKEQLTIAEDAGRQVKVLKQELKDLEETRGTLAEKWNVADEKRLKAAADRHQAEAIAAEEEEH